MCGVQSDQSRSFLTCARCYIGPTDDGATLLKLLDIVHPAARTLVDIARAQDAEVGDGTTSVTLLAAEILKELRPYVEEGVGVHTIIKGLRRGSELVSVVDMR
jgi:T-complex protein 1 subunit eta